MYTAFGLCDSEVSNISYTIYIKGYNGANACYEHSYVWRLSPTTGSCTQSFANQDYSGSYKRLLVGDYERWWKC